MRLSRHATRHYSALPATDSITVDPHKSGYIPYPAGALCYRNGAMRDLVTFKAPYIVHDEAEPAMGIYGLEGSKPGAAVAAVYLAHKVIRPTKRGYGKIHGKSLFNCKRVYARLLSMAQPEDRFVVVPVPRLPSEIAGSSAEAELRFIRERIDGRSDEELLADAQAMALLPELGPDVNILTYAFNFKHADGRLNTSLAQANRLNKAIYETLSLKPGEDVASHDLIVSTTDFEEAHYGKLFVESYKRRLGVGDSEGERRHRAALDGDEPLAHGGRGGLLPRHAGERVPRGHFAGHVPRLDGSGLRGDRREPGRPPGAGGDRGQPPRHGPS